MTRSVERMIDDIIEREGGFVNHPADRGRPTNFGITRKALSQYLGRAATVEEIRHLSRDVAEDVYRKDYYAAPRIDTLPERIRPFVFDAAVNHGPRRAIRLVQQVCNAAGFGSLDVDGICGPSVCSARCKPQFLWHSSRQTRAGAAAGATGPAGQGARPL